MAGWNRIPPRRHGGDGRGADSRTPRRRRRPRHCRRAGRAAASRRSRPGGGRDADRGRRRLHPARSGDRDVGGGGPPARRRPPPSAARAARRRGRAPLPHADAGAPDRTARRSLPGDSERRLGNAALPGRSRPSRSLARDLLASRAGALEGRGYRAGDAAGRSSRDHRPGRRGRDGETARRRARLAGRAAWRSRADERPASSRTNSRGPAFSRRPAGAPGSGAPAGCRG